MALILRPPGTGESLTDRLADLGRARKRVAVATGVFALVAAVLGCVGLVCLLDAGFHLPPLARAAALALTLAAGGGLWLRGVARPLALRTDPLAVALELEDRHPALNDVLASAVSFLEAGDAEDRGVSSRLQDAAVRVARRKADRHDFDALVPAGRCWRAVWACAVVVAVVAPLALVDLGRARTALTRLADPFGSHPYPTRTRVEVLAPERFPARMPKGDPFGLRFAVRGVIPDRATVTLRFHPGEDLVEQYPLTAGNDPERPGAAVVSVKLDAGKIPGPFAVRVTANDADTGWREVDVVPPPRLVPRDGRPTPQFHVTPPAYTGLPTGNLPDAAQAIELPAGSGVRLSAAADVRLTSAALVYLGDRAGLDRPPGLAAIGHLNPFTAVGCPSLTGLVTAEIPVTIAPDGRGLTATFAPVLSGPYVLRMTDETGLTGTRPIEIRLVPDPAPTVTLLRPSVGHDPAVLTPAAAVPVEVGADDKLYGVRRTFLEYRVGRDGVVRTIALADARAVTDALPAAVGGSGTLGWFRPTATGVALSVPVAAFTRDDGSPVRPGDTLFVRGAADDWDDVTPAKEPGRSAEVEIRIASAEAIEAWLQRELAAMRPDLIRARDQQREARTRALDATPQPDGTLAPADRDRLLSSEQIQRQVRGRVADERDGLRARADALRATVRANNLPRSNTTDRVEAVADELGRLSDRDLPVIGPTLAGARQFGALPPTPGLEQIVRDQLTKAGRHQKAVEVGLTNLLDALAVWGSAAEIRGEARVLRDQTQRQAGEVGRFEPKTPAAELERAGIRADQAAEQAGQLVARATRFAAEKDKHAAASRAAAGEREGEATALAAEAAALPPGHPDKSALNAKAATLRAEAADLRAAADKAAAEAAALNTGVKAAGGQTLPEELRAAADAARKNRPFEAANLLNSAADRLGKLADALAERDDEAPDLAKLKKAADDLDALAAAQDDLRKRAADAAKRAAAMRALAAEQEKLIERGRQILQRLTRERAAAAARDARAALERMEAARGDLESGEPGSRAQNEAVERLDTARDRIDAAAAAAPEWLADETRRKLADRVKALSERQKAAVAEAARIHGLVARNKGWDRDVLTSYIDLGDVEKKLAEDVRALGKEFAPLPVLARVTSEAAAALEAADKRITARREEIDPTLAFDPELEAANDRKVKRPVDLAARRLGQLLDALQADDPKGKKENRPAPKAPNGPMTPPPAGGGGNQDLIPPQAQLKVLRALQAELNQRTAEFATANLDPDKLTDEGREELKELEQAQRDIAALFEHMARLFDEQKQPDKPEPPEPEKKP